MVAWPGEFHLIVWRIRCVLSSFVSFRMPPLAYKTLKLLLSQRHILRLRFSNNLTQTCFCPPRFYFFQGMVFLAVSWGAEPNVLFVRVRWQGQLLSADQPGLLHQPWSPEVLQVHRTLHCHGKCTISQHTPKCTSMFRHKMMMIWLIFFPWNPSHHSFVFLFRPCSTGSSSTQVSLCPSTSASWTNPLLSKISSP